MFRQTTSARPLVWLFGVGAVAAGLSLVLGPAGADRTQVAGICGAAWGLAAILCFAPGRLPRWAIHVFLACGTLLVEWVTLSTGDPSSPYPILYFWVATCAFCFLSRIEAAVQAVLIAIAYAAGLALLPGDHQSDALRWVLFSLALAVGGTFIGALRLKHDQLVDELRTAAHSDPVTGLLGARGFAEAIVNEIERSRRSGSRFGLIVGAIDGYDDIRAKERTPILRLVGAVFDRAKRGIDTAARLGDGEFAVIATYTDERGAQVLAERITSSVRDDSDGATTMSLGVVSHPRHGASAPVLLSAAREALADAAAIGGDRSLTPFSPADAIEARLQDADVHVVAVPPGE